MINYNHISISTIISSFCYNSIIRCNKISS